MIRVYHAIDTTFIRAKGDPVDFPANFVHVADVDAPMDLEGLEVAFQLTNTIDRPWWQLPSGVKFVRPDWKGSREWALRQADIVKSKYRQPDTAAAIRRQAGTGFRSTSVGDVMEMDGRYYVVDMAGFSEISPSGGSALHGFGRMTKAEQRQHTLNVVNQVLVAREAYLQRMAGRRGIAHGELRATIEGIRLATSLFIRRYKQLGRGLKELRKEIQSQGRMLRRYEGFEPTSLWEQEAAKVGGMKEVLRIAEGGEPSSPEEPL